MEYRVDGKQVITVVLNTNHNVRYFPLDAATCYSEWHSTRIAEVDNTGEPDDRETVNRAFLGLEASDLAFDSTLPRRMFDRDQ